MIIKKLFLILLITSSINGNILFAQIDNICSFADEQSIDSINIALLYHKVPFEIIQSENRSFQDIYHINKKKSKIISTYSNLESIYKITNNDKHYFLILFYDYVGYDFFLIIQENPLKVYISENFNYKQDEGYDFIDNDFNIKNGELKIRYSESRKEESVRYKQKNCRRIRQYIRLSTSLQPC